MNQPTLFEAENETAEIEKVLLFALGDFQSRKKVLADRELPLDRLRGAFKRAAEKFGIAEIPDEQIAESLDRVETMAKESTSISRPSYGLPIQPAPSPAFLRLPLRARRRNGEARSWPMR